MGRHRRDWDPKGFENSRERQRRRQIVPLPSEDPPAPEDGPTPTTLQTSGSSRIDMEASIPNGMQHATPAPPAVQGSNVNKTGLYTTVGREDAEILTEARVKVVPGSKKPGITEDFARQIRSFNVLRPKTRRRSFTEGPEPTDRLRTDYATKIKIGHPGGSDPVSRTANVLRPVPYRVLDYDVMLPSNHRGFCESRDEEEQPVDIGGHHFATINHPEQFNWLLDGRQHDDISNGGTCRLCFDLAMLRARIYPLYPT